MREFLLSRGAQSNGAQSYGASSTGTRSPGMPARGQRPIGPRSSGTRSNRLIPCGLLSNAMRSIAVAALPATVHAHGRDHAPTLADAWTLSPWLLVPAVLAVALYACGLARLWRRAGVGRGIAMIEVAAFAGGVAALFAALVWPLDALGEWSLAAHMGQHMLLLALAPPLLLLGRPGAAFAHALPGRAATVLRRASAPVHARGLAALSAATAVHVAVMGLWHVPVATVAALAHDALHWTMHASFLAAGLWFWAAMLHRIRDRETGVGAALIAVLVVMMQMGFVGALLTFAPQPLYGPYVERAPALGLDALADQQLAGLVMWVPACVPYVVGGLWLLIAWLARLDRLDRHGGHAGPAVQRPNPRRSGA